MWLDVEEVGHLSIERDDNHEARGVDNDVQSSGQVRRPHRLKLIRFLVPAEVPMNVDGYVALHFLASGLLREVSLLHDTTHVTGDRRRNITG